MVKFWNKKLETFDKVSPQTIFLQNF